MDSFGEIFEIEWDRIIDSEQPLVHDTNDLLALHVIQNIANKHSPLNTLLTYINTTINLYVYSRLDYAAINSSIKIEEKTRRTQPEKKRDVSTNVLPPWLVFEVLIGIVEDIFAVCSSAIHGTNWQRSRCGSLSM